MKELFGVNLDIKAEDPDAVGYEAATVDEDLMNQMKTVDAGYDDIKKEMKLPLGYRLLYWLCYVAQWLMFICIMTFLRGLLDADMDPATGMRMWKAIGFQIIVLIIFVLIRRYIAHKQQALCDSVTDGVEVKSLFSETERVFDEAKRVLGVPEDAKIIDVYLYFYKNKGGTNVAYAKVLNTYVTLGLDVFVKNNILSIATRDERYDIPLEDIIDFTVVKKRACQDSWNKDISWNEGEYKQYKMKMDGYERLWVQGHCSLVFMMQGQEFTVRFPLYEKETIEDLIGRKAQ